MNPNSLMLLATSSSAGKSVFTLAICNYLRQKGFASAPFKAVNVAGHFGAKQDALVIADAQLQQSFAAGAQPSPDMSPIIIKLANDKPKYIIMGEHSDVDFDTHSYKDLRKLRAVVSTAYQYLIDEYGAVICEGNGSPVELNYRKRDYANLWLAKKFDIPCIIVCNFDNCGGFASLVGTLALMTRKEKDLVKGFIINNMENPKAFSDGVTMLQDKTKKPCFGVVPKFREMSVWQEDGSFPNKSSLSSGAIDDWTDHVTAHCDMNALLSHLKPKVVAKFENDSPPR